jgi:hypothetical protein
MRLITLVAVLGLLSVPSAAGSTVTVFDGGTRSGTYGLRISDLGWIAAAADFELSGSLPVTGAAIWTTEYPGMFQWSGTLNYYVFADVSGAPVGPPIYSGSVAAVREADPLTDCCGYDEFKYSFTFASPLNLQAHTRYWLAVNLPGGGTFATTQAFWAGATTTFGHDARLMFDPSTGSSLEYYFDLAFRLFSDVGDKTPPTLTFPAGILVDASGPTGAAVTYDASAADDVDGDVPVTCTPPSGSTFPIGTTTVNCEATDTAGNRGTASFSVHVKGAAEQLDDLLAAVAAIGPGGSLADKVHDVQSALAKGAGAKACDGLGAFLNQVKAQSGKTLSSEQEATLVAAAERISAVLAC